MEREAICPTCSACYPVNGDSTGRQFRCGMCRTVFTCQESGPALPLKPPLPSARRARPARRAAALPARRTWPLWVGTATAGAVVMTLVAMAYRSNSEARERAEASGKQAIAGEAQARRALADLKAEQARLLTRQRRIAPSLVRVGRLALYYGRWDEAYDFLNTALAHDPSLAEARFLRAAALLAEKDYSGAASELETCVDDRDARTLIDVCRKVYAGEIAPEAASRLFAGIFVRRREPALAAPHLQEVERRAEAYRRVLSQALPTWRDEALRVGAEGDLRLDLSGSGVCDLTPLKDFLLDALVLDANPVCDLEPLREMPLRSLSLSEAGALTDLSPLSGMPLEELNVVSCRSVRDLSPLRGLPLKRLSVYGTPVADLSPLKGMRLERLDVSHTAVSDLGPLKGAPLQTFSAEATSVRDLAPLQGMPLWYLSLDFTAVTDLSPIRGAPLCFVSLLGTPAKDLSALEGMPLEVLRFEPREVTSGIERVRSIPTLMTVATLETGGMPAEEFWYRYDGRTRR